MKRITITKELFDKVIEGAFKRGEAWGVTYSSWFTPDETDRLVEIDDAKKEAYSLAIQSIN